MDILVVFALTYGPIAHTYDTVCAGKHVIMLGVK